MLLTTSFNAWPRCLCTVHIRMGAQPVLCLQVALLAEVVDAWLRTAEQQQGLFSRRSDPRAPTETQVADPSSTAPGDPWAVSQEAGDAQADTTHTQAAPPGRAHEEVVQQVQAHLLWLAFFWEMWQVWTPAAADASAIGVVGFCSMPLLYLIVWCAGFRARFLYPLIMAEGCCCILDVLFDELVLRPLRMAHDAFQHKLCCPLAGGAGQGRVTRNCAASPLHKPTAPVPGSAPDSAPCVSGRPRALAPAGLELCQSPGKPCDWPSHPPAAGQSIRVFACTLPARRRQLSSCSTKEVAYVSIMCIHVVHLALPCKLSINHSHISIHIIALLMVC